MSDPHADEMFVRCNRLDLMEALADDLAHEIKNPLHSIALHLEILRRRMAGASGVDHEETERYFGRLAMDVERVSGRLEVLLRLTRTPREGETTLHEAVHTLEEIFRLAAKHHKLRLEFELGEAKGPLAPAPGLVHQLLLNMIRIATTRAPEHAAVIVRTGPGDRGAELDVAVDADGAAPLPDDSDEDMGALRELARLMDVDVELVSGTDRDEDWCLSARIERSRGTRTPPAGV